MKPAAQNRFGIRILYEKSGDGFRARFFAGDGVSGKSFVTNPAIRKALETGKYRLDEYIGGMEVTYEPSHHAVYWRYYPFGHDKEFRRFPQVGAADLLELRVSDEIKKWFPKDAKIVHINPEGPRQLQLQKRGVTFAKMRDGYSQNENRSMLRKKIASDYKKYSPKNRK